MKTLMSTLPDHSVILVLAPTNVLAVSMNGNTFDSVVLSRRGGRRHSSNILNLEVTEKHKRVLHNTKLIWIEEAWSVDLEMVAWTHVIISKVKYACESLEIESLCWKKIYDIKSSDWTPMGGVSVVLSGDPAQKEPVLAKGKPTDLRAAFSSASVAIQLGAKVFQSCRLTMTLTKNHRMDSELASITENLRTMSETALDIKKLQTRTIGHPRNPTGNKVSLNFLDTAYILVQGNSTRMAVNEFLASLAALHKIVFAWECIDQRPSDELMVEFLEKKGYAALGWRLLVLLTKTESKKVGNPSHFVNGATCEVTGIHLSVEQQHLVLSKLRESPRPRIIHLDSPPLGIFIKLGQGHLVKVEEDDSKNKASQTTGYIPRVKRRGRTQIAATMAYGFTLAKAQGATMSFVLLATSLLIQNVGRSDLYMALTRCGQLQKLLIGNAVTLDRLKATPYPLHVIEEMERQARNYLNSKEELIRLARSSKWWHDDIRESIDIQESY